MKPRKRVREAVKQIEIALEDVEGGHYADLDEAAIRLRGVADRLEDEAEEPTSIAELLEQIEEDPDDVQETILDVNEPDPVQT